MSYKSYKIVLMGTLTYDDDCLKLDGHRLVSVILNHLPPSNVLDRAHDFGKVRVEVAFENYTDCPHCGVVVGKEAACG